MECSHWNIWVESGGQWKYVFLFILMCFFNDNLFFISPRHVVYFSAGFFYAESLFLMSVLFNGKLSLCVRSILILWPLYTNVSCFSWQLICSILCDFHICRHTHMYMYVCMYLSISMFYIYVSMYVCLWSMYLSV